MALTTDYEEIGQRIARVGQGARPETPEQLSTRLDALVEAVEILARDHYEFPALPESSLRSALSRARRPGARWPRRG
jgi:hypothetical protein